jgi:membrane protein required for colicin V production
LQIQVFLLSHGTICYGKASRDDTQEVNMETTQLNPYDVVVIGIVAAMALRGLWLGMLRQVVPLISLVTGFLVASRYHDQLLPFLRDLSDNPKVVFLSAYLLLFIVTFVACSLLGLALRKVMQIIVAGWFDRIVGGVVGAVQGVIIVVLIHLLIGSFIAPENDLLDQCRTCPTLHELSEQARALIKDEDIREAMRRVQPAIGLDQIPLFEQSPGLDEQPADEPGGHTPTGSREDSFFPDQPAPVE